MTETERLTADSEKLVELINFPNQMHQVRVVDVEFNGDDTVDVIYERYGYET